MEGRRAGNIPLVVRLMLLVAMFGVHSVTAHLPLPAGTCIHNCMHECEHNGVDFKACLKYCPVHCIPPDTSTRDHYCNLGCMLDHCAKFTDEETRMSDCVYDCNKYHCKTTG